MKKIKIIALSLFSLASIVGASGLTISTASCQRLEATSEQASKQNQTINMFVTHGHCSTPFAGVVENLKVVTLQREDQGNPLEGLKISFEIDPNTFNVCAGEELTARIKTPGLFIGENDENITFISTDVYTMGLNWYQLNGKMSIKGVVADVKFFVTGIREPQDSAPSSLVLSGQVNLFEWGIDYDKIVDGKSSPIATKLLYINMQIEMPVESAE